ncbi:VF530 family protein [Thalassotalea fusca]
MDNQPFNPLHGITLKTIVTELVDHFGFERLGNEFKMKCFQQSPSIKSALTFLRKTPWAREKVEAFYIKNKHLVHK